MAQLPPLSSTSATAGEGAAATTVLGANAPPTVASAANSDPVETALANMASPDRPTIHEGVVQLRKLLSVETNPPIQSTIDAGAVPVLVELLDRDDDTKLQFEAAWALTNIAGGTSHHVEVVLTHGALVPIVHLLSSPDGDVREQAVWAVGNIAGDSPTCRDQVLRAGAMGPLLTIMDAEGTKPTLLGTAAWALSNLCRGRWWGGAQVGGGVVRRPLVMPRRLIHLAHFVCSEL